MSNIQPYIQPNIYQIPQQQTPQQQTPQQQTPQQQIPQQQRPQQQIPQQQIPQQQTPQEQRPQEQRKKSFSIKLLILIAVLVFLIVVIIWTIWAYFWFRYDYSRVNSKIIKRYMIANPNPFDKNTEDIKSDNITYNSNKTTLTADIIIFDKITLSHKKKDNILLKISETCIPVSSNCIKL